MTRQKIIVAGVLAIGVASGLGFWFLSPGPNTLKLPGTVETQEVRLSSKIGGRVRKIAVREGDIVQPGQALVYLDAPELEARRDQLQANLDSAQAMLEKAQNGPRVEEKAAAKAAANIARARLQRLKAGYRPEEIEVALGEYKSKAAELDRAQKEWDREDRLRKAGATSTAQIDAAWAVFTRLKEQVVALEAHWKMLASGNRVEDIAEAEAELARAEANFQLLEQGTRAEDIADAKARVAELYARLREIDANLQEAVVTAPDAALVEIVAVRRGDTVNPNQPLVRVLLAEDLWVKAYVPEPALGQIRLGQEVKLTVDAYPGKTFRGIISHIASVSEFTPRNVATADERRSQVFAFRVRVLESAQVFKSGMAADVILPLVVTPEQ